MTDTNELVQEKVTRLLGSQRAWLLGTQKHRAMGGGFRLGKTFSLCLGGMLVSYLMPGNKGFIGRAVGKDLAQTTIQTFFDEVCPSEMLVGKPRKVGQFGMECYLKTVIPGRTSHVYFDYITDRQSGKFHLAGGNWGWFAVDQAEEIGRNDYMKLVSRLSRKEALRKHALINFNQNGHDWIFEDFYQSGDYKFDVKKYPDIYHKAIVTGNKLGIIARSEENRLSNGGFVEDDYFDELRRSYPPAWCARYLDGSFDNFSGKIYADYDLGSVHNIEPFEIPDHWPTVVGIDVGGSVPWAIGVWRVDEYGNRVLTNDASPLYRPNMNPNTVIAWLKDNTPLSSRYVIDYENRPVMIQLQDEGIHCEPAVKDVLAGITQLMGDFWPMPGKSLPEWYRLTQPKARYDRFRDGGAPRVYIFNTCVQASKEFDNYIWNPLRPNEPVKRDDHHCDQAKYVAAAKPTPAVGRSVDPYAAFRLTDPTSARHLDGVAKELARQRQGDWLRRQQQMEMGDGGAWDASVQYIEDFG
jgi:hypothetical protein